MMKKKIIKICAWAIGIITVTCLALMLVCNQKEVNNAEEKVSVGLSESDKELIEHEKRLEEYYRKITDPLEEIIDGHNSFDYVPINNRTIDWFKKCRTDLIKVYDSSHTSSYLSDEAKVDSLFMELEAYYNLNEEETNRHLGIRNQRMIKSMILYRITDRTIEMLQRHPNFKNEQMAWERMQIALEEFYLTAEELEYTGGSGSDALCLMAMNAIYKNRYEDLTRMLHDKGLASTNIMAAKGKFIQSVDSIEKDITEEFTKEEWNAWKDIPQLIDRMHKAREPLMKALDDWITERKQYNGCANAIVDLTHTISGKR